MASSSTSSTQRARPQSANPSRRTRTASSIHHHHHKSADLEEHPITAPATTPEEDLNRPITNQVVVPNITKISSPPPYDSLVTFECIQKASALRVLAKTLDRQRDVSSNQNAIESSSEVEHHQSSHRSSTAQPRKLRPLAREFSGPLWINRLLHVTQFSFMCVCVQCGFIWDDDECATWITNSNKEPWQRWIIFCFVFEKTPPIFQKVVCLGLGLDNCQKLKKFD